MDGAAVTRFVLSRRYTLSSGVIVDQVMSAWDTRDEVKRAIEDDSKALGSLSDNVKRGIAAIGIVGLAYHVTTSEVEGPPLIVAPTGLVVP